VDPTAPDPPALLVPTRFCGPPGTGNGGYVAGRLADVWLAHGGVGAVRVTLRQPPPLQTPLDVRVDGTGVTATFGGAVIADATPAALDGAPVDPVPFAVAQAAMAGFVSRQGHPFPGCFVCGSDRPAPDGLGLRPGPVADRPGTVATTWVPSSAGGQVPAALVWAALDCPSGWAADLAEHPRVLGRITAEVDARPEPGDRCVVVGRLLGTEGRKAFTASTAYDADGRVLGRAEATWLQVDLARYAPG
jgi:hypothetical protein